MDYKKYFKEKLKEFFGDKLKVMEKKSIIDLKEIEIMKYELNDIYEDNHDEMLIDKLKNKKLFLSYFDEEDISTCEIQNVNSIFIEGIKFNSKEENLISPNKNSNQKNETNKIKNFKTNNLSFANIKNLEELLRQKENQIKNKNSSLNLLNSSNQQSYRTLSNNIPEKFLNINSNNLISNYCTIYNQKNNESNKNNFKPSTNGIISKNNNSKENKNKPNKIGHLNKIKESHISKYVNEPVNEQKMIGSAINKNITHLYASNEKNLDQINFVDNNTVDINESSNITDDKNNLYNSFSPQDNRYTTNFNEKILVENIASSNFLNNINININHLNNPPFSGKESLKKTNIAENVICSKLNIVKKKTSDNIDDLFNNSNNFDSIHNQTNLSFTENNYKNNNDLNEIINCEHETETNQLSQNPNNQIILDNNKITNMTRLQKNLLSPYQTISYSNNYINFNTNTQNKNNLIKSNTIRNKINSTSLPLQEAINKKIINNSSKSINNKANVQSSVNINHFSNILEHSFSNVFNFNLNLDNEKHLITTNINTNTRNQDQNKIIYDQAIFNHIQTNRGSDVLDLNNTKNRKLTNNLINKSNFSHRKTLSMTNNLILNNKENLSYKKITDKVPSTNKNKTNRILFKDNNTNELSKSQSKTKKILTDSPNQNGVLATTIGLSETKWINQNTKSHNIIDLINNRNFEGEQIREKEEHDNVRKSLKITLKKEISKSISKLGSRNIKNKSLEIRTDFDDDSKLNKMYSSKNASKSNRYNNNYKSPSKNQKTNITTKNKTPIKLEKKNIFDIGKDKDSQNNENSFKQKNSLEKISLTNSKSTVIERKKRHQKNKSQIDVASNLLKNINVNKNSNINQKEKNNKNKSNYRKSQGTIDKPNDKMNLEDNNSQGENEEKSHSLISNINPRKATLQKDKNKFIEEKNKINIQPVINNTEDSSKKNNFLRISTLDFSEEDNTNENQEKGYDMNNENNISHHSIADNFSVNEKANFHEDINKSIEKEIKKDLLLNDININMNTKESDLEDKPYNDDIINNLFNEEKENINNSNNINKSIDTEERKLITPKFSPLNHGAKKFSFIKEDDKRLPSLHLILKSCYLPLNKTIELIKGTKILYEDNDLIEKIRINYLKLKIKIKTNFLNEKFGNANPALLCEKFSASITSRNGLSLFTKAEVNNLLTKEQPIEIINFFKFFCLILQNKIIECENDEKFIRTLFEKYFPENSNIKSVIIDLCSKIFLISDEVYYEIINFVNNHPEVINSTGLLRKNRSCSYISFLLKEIYDYHNMKAEPTNYPVYKLRFIFNEIQQLDDELEKMESNLKEKFMNKKIAI